MKLSVVEKSLLLAVSAALLSPSEVRACACGCGVFEIGTSSMFPKGPGGMAFVEYDYQDQNQNYYGSSRAPAADNDDKDIKTHFITTGLQYMFNRSWGVKAEIPFVYRSFLAEDAGTPMAAHWSGLGDIRVEGIYTGFSPDLSSGLTLGLKLPTGDFAYRADTIDRDTQIGSGSTDLLLGAFHRGRLSVTGDWNWFVAAKLDLPIWTQDQYRPGLEVNAAAGVYYSGWNLGGVQVSPLAQIIASERTRDTGDNAIGGAQNPGQVATGSERLLISPGMEFNYHSFRVDAAVQVPVYQHFTGNQLASSITFKLVLSYHF